MGKLLVFSFSVFFKIMFLFLCYIINRHELGGCVIITVITQYGKHFSLTDLLWCSTSWLWLCRWHIRCSGWGDFAGSVAFFWWADDFNGSNLLLQKCCINTTLAVPRIQYQLFIQMYSLMIEDNTKVLLRSLDTLFLNKSVQFIGYTMKNI